MNEQQCKDEARNKLKTYIDQMRLTNEYGGMLEYYPAFPDHPNVWEGETGMMKHIHSPFSTMLADQKHQIQKEMYICTALKLEHGQILMDVNECDAMDTSFTRTTIETNMFQVKDKCMPSNSICTTEPYPFASSSLNTDANKRKTHLKASTLSKKNKANKPYEKNDNDTYNCATTMNQKRLYLVDLARQDVTKTTSLFNRKIEKWKVDLSNIQSVQAKLETALSLTSEHLICGQFPKKVYESWRHVCFLIECLCVDMEIERMALRPDTTFFQLSFPLDLQKNMKKPMAKLIRKNYLHIKEALGTLSKRLKSIYKCKINLFQKYNNNIEITELKITVPSLLSLHRQNRYFQLLQGKLLISHMTPGQAAGILGKEESIQDRYLTWLEQCYKSFTKMDTNDRDYAESSTSNLKQCEKSQDSYFNAGSKAFQKSVYIDNSNVSIASDHTFDEGQVFNCLTNTDEKQDNTECPTVTEVAIDGTLTTKTETVPLNTHIIDPSLCLVTEYDEQSLEIWGIDGPNFCTYFENTYHSWHSKAQEIESTLKQVDSVLSLRIEDNSFNPTTEFACQTLSHACSTLQFLYIKYVCAKLSQRSHNVTNTWRFSRPVCTMLGAKIKDKLSKRFSNLNLNLKQIGRICKDMFDEHKNIIRSYNNQVGKKSLVLLPMHLLNVSEQIRDMVKCNSVAITPLTQFLCLEEKAITNPNFLTQQNEHISLTKNVGFKGSQDESVKNKAGDLVNCPNILKKKQNRKKREKEDIVSAFVTHQQTILGSDITLDLNLLFLPGSSSKLAASQSQSEEVENLRSCECGCHGVSLYSKSKFTVKTNGRSSAENLKMLQKRIKVVNTLISEAEVKLGLCENFQQSACKLFVDVGATLPYFRASLNAERAETFKHTYAGVSASVKNEMDNLNMTSADEEVIDFFAVEKTLALLFNNFKRILSERGEIILGIFPHAEDFKNKRGDLIQFYAPLHAERSFLRIF